MWGMSITEMISDWKQFGKLPLGIHLPKAIPIDCLDSGKNMSSVGCANHSTMNFNEYNLPEKMLFC